MKFLRFFFVAALVCAVLAGCRGIGDALRQYGYTEIRPPSRLFEPGSLVWVEGVQPFKAGVICPARKALGDNFQPKVSRTMDSKLQRATRKGITIKADLTAIAAAGVDVSAIKSMSMTFSNAKVVEVSDYDISTRASLAGDPLCAQLLHRRHQAGYAVTMISSALQADVVYAVTWHKAAVMDANIRIAALQGLSVGLDLGASDIGDRTVSAKGLFWGIRDDQFLAKLFRPDLMQRKISRESRVLSIASVPQVLPTVDANAPLEAIPEAEEPGPEGHTDSEWEVLQGHGPYGAPPGHGRPTTYIRAEKSRAADANAPSESDTSDDSEDTESIVDSYSDETDETDTDDTSVSEDPLDSWEPDTNELPSKRQSSRGSSLPLERSGSYLGNSRSNPRRQR